MWKQFFELMRQMLRLTEDTQQNRADLKELQKELRDFSVVVEREIHELRRAVERLAYEIQRVSDRETSEREKLALELENRLLRAERGLPPAKPEPDNE